MVFAERVENTVVLDAPWSETQRIKLIPGAAWNHRLSSWTIPLSYGSCVTMRGVFGNDLTIGSELNEWLWNDVNTRVQPAMQLRNAYELAPGWPVFNDHDERLYPFQRIGREFLVTAGDVLLGDDMGTGKTIQVLTAMRRVNELNGTSAFPALVICPNSIKSHWAARIEEWLPEATPYVITGSAAQKRKVIDVAKKDPTAIIIVNIESVRLLSRVAGYGSIRLKKCIECDRHFGDRDLKPAQCETHHKELNEISFTTCVLDEAHRVKDPNAKQTRAIWYMFRQPGVERRWALTGTPIANHPGELWSAMHAICPSEYATRSTFIDRYALCNWNQFGAMDVIGLRLDTKKEFFKFFDARFRRMPKALVMPQLPPKTRIIHNIEMTPKQRKAYKSMSESMVSMIDDRIIIARSNLAAQTRLLQLSSSYCDIEYGDDLDDMSQWKVTLRDPCPKADALISIIKDAKVETIDGPSIAVVAEHRQLIDLVAQHLDKLSIEYVTITGVNSEHERTENLKKFQNRDVKIILFTYKAGGVGLDMTAASMMVRLQRSWSLVDNKQGEDRVHRIGSEKHDSVTIIDVITDDTIEETQMERLSHKFQRLEEINRDRVSLNASGVDTSYLDEEENMIMNTYLGE